MSNFQWYQDSYEWGWCTLAQLQAAVELGQITAAQYETICGQVYQAPTNNTNAVG